MAEDVGFIASDVGFVPSEDVGFIPKSDDLGFVAKEAPQEKGFLARAAEFIQKPLVNISPRTVAKMIPLMAALGPQAGAGVAEAVSEAASALTSPLNIGIAGAAVIAPGIVGPIVAGLGAKAAGEALGAQSVASELGDERESARLGTQALLSGAQAAIAPVMGARAAALPRSVAALELMQKDAPPVILESISAPEQPPAVSLETPPPISTAQESASARMGILPPGAPEAAKLISDTGTRLDQLRQGFRNLQEAKPVREDIIRKFDAADNEARISGEQTGNSLRLDLPSKVDRDAVTFIVEANGDRARLAEFAAKVSGNSKAEKAIQLAQSEWDRLAPVAERVNKLHDEQLAYEQANGIDPGNVEGYVRHVYDMDAMIGRGRPILLSNPKGGGGVATSFKKQRTFETYADAIEAGFKPKTFDIADLVQSRITIGERLINRTKWANSLSSMVDPAEGTPIVTDVTIQQPKGTQVAPMGYARREILPGVPIAVHEGYVKLIDALTGTSQVRSSSIGSALLNTEAFVKHGMLMFDSFHAGRMIYKELALTGKAKHDLGRSLLEYSNEDLVKAVEAKEITQQAADWTLANRPDAELLISHGLNVGRISDVLYKDVVKSIPLVGPFNKWVFDKLTRGAMMQSAIVELNRFRAAQSKPGLKKYYTEDEMAGLVSKNINTYYGNLGKQGLLQSATFQDLARIIMLAPQWVEGMARTEIGAATQMGKIPVNIAKGEGLIVGTLAKGVGTGVLAAFTANQLINMATRGHPTWDNPEHGHQLDAFIPDVGGNSPGFFLNPMSVFAELTHDAIRYYEADPALKVASRIASNKQSPLMRAEEVLRTGRDWMGRDLQTTWERSVEASRALIPAPIPLQPVVPFTGKNAPPGSFQRQLFASTGIKIEPAPTAESQLFSLARRFKAEQGIKEKSFEPSEYRDLNMYLRKEDWKSAKKEFERLSQDKSEKTVREHYQHLTSRIYTGKRQLEADFKASLNEDQQILLDKAREERLQMRDRFLEMLGK